MKIDDAFVERVEERIGHSHIAWDTISPIDICEAVRDELSIAEVAAYDTEHCSKCCSVLNNVSPGFGILGGKLKCMPCIEASGKQPQAIARGL